MTTKIQLLEERVAVLEQQVTSYQGIIKETLETVVIELQEVLKEEKDRKKNIEALCADFAKLAEMFKVPERKTFVGFTHKKGIPDV